MRPLDDILRDVIEKLEPRGTLPEPSKLGERSPLGLYVSRSERKFIQTEEGEEIHCGICWGWRYDVDTGELIDAAKTAGYTVSLNEDPGWHDCAAHVYRDGVNADRLVGASINPKAREAVILALAEALGVEREE